MVPASSEMSSNQLNLSGINVEDVKTLSSFWHISSGLYLLWELLLLLWPPVRLLHSFISLNPILHSDFLLFSLESDPKVTFFFFFFFYIGLTGGWISFIINLHYSPIFFLIFPVFPALYFADTLIYFFLSLLCFQLKWLQFKLRRLRKVGQRVE